VPSLVFAQEIVPSQQIPNNSDGKFGGCPWKNMQFQEHRQGHNFSPWGFMKAEEAYIIEKAHLTGAEANFLFPLFHKQKDKQREIDEKIRHLRFQAYNNLSNETSSSILKQIHALEIQNIRVEQDYQRKILKGLTATKLLRVINADKHFERDMLRHMMMGSPKGMFMKSKKLEKE